ncbi:helix-turn-helix domain-containing protein [Brevibacillus laterosporus]|uniref:helix-turn-helix domain-containing protein n=1 Tax=Brevibacillus laterosporus TaxID=1465 RepID=UPI000374E293|nr:helix-turn-helix domain-containing protein [Brevibacillus laterosporus]MED2001819.1 helix-turn-helix domain-containing protein [Brevibacillus laterosporus]MED4764105.1 helix-turn-helix domain-containing protein [Brevibacillus laterosporus]
MTGVSKGVISKIESGETKRPELRTLKPIADVLNIPYEEIIEGYIKVEHRFGILHDFLMEVAEISKPDLMEKVAVKFLESSKKDSVESLEDLFRITGTFRKNDIMLTLYNIIIRYARAHGESQYIAKGLYQKYMIEREELKHLEESFKVGEEVLHYVDFLSQEEKFTLYYRMALHAHNIKKYDKCVELGKMGIQEDETKNDLKESVALAMCNSFVEFEDHASLHLHLDECEKKEYHFIVECINYYRAIILSQRGDYEKAIPLLQECLEEVKGIRRLYRLNRLLEALSKARNIELIREIIQSEENHFSFNPVTPHQYAQIGMYYKFTGNFLIENGQFDLGIEQLLQSISYYALIGSYKDIIECSKEIFYYHALFIKHTKFEIAGKLNELYNEVTMGEKRE